MVIVNILIHSSRQSVGVVRSRRSGIEKGILVEDERFGVTLTPPPREPLRLLTTEKKLVVLLLGNLHMLPLQILQLSSL